MSALAWLQAQAQILGSIVGAVVTNKPEPARQVLIYTAVLIGIAWLVFKIVGKSGK